MSTDTTTATAKKKRNMTLDEKIEALRVRDAEREATAAAKKEERRAAKAMDAANAVLANAVTVWDDADPSYRAALTEHVLNQS